MQRTKYAVEFKDEAFKQVIDKGHSVWWAASTVLLQAYGENSSPF